MDTDIIYASVVTLAQAIRTRSLSSEEVVAAHLRRIASVNPRLNAVVELAADTAVAQARAADAMLARGEVLGPLHGVPMTIKDNLDTAGVISTGGTTGRAAYVPAQDATMVARLRAAGAILLGKTNTPELTLAFETDNLVYGRTSNPHDLAVPAAAAAATRLARQRPQPTQRFYKMYEATCPAKRRKSYCPCALEPATLYSTATRR
jgi:amidase